MGIFSSDKKTTTNTTSYITTIGLENIEGPAVVGDGNTVTTTDHGALEAAATIGLEALSMGRANFDTAAGLAGRAIDAGGQATRDALGFGGDVLGESFSLVRDLVDSTFSGQQSLVQSNIEGLTALARQTSESADDRVTRVVLIVAVAAAAIFVLPQMFKG